MSVSVPQTLQSRKEAFTELLVSRIENAYIENEDYKKILESRNVENAFHFIDPPYAGSDQGHYGGWTVTDDQILFTWLAELCKGKFLLTNYNSQLLDEFIRAYGWYKKEITMKLSGAKGMNSRKGREAKGRESRTEVLVSNYKSPCGTIQLFN